MPNPEFSNPAKADHIADPVVLKTDQPGLILKQMTSLQDDLEYLQLQQRNAGHIAEFGNTVDSTVEEVTARRTNKHMSRFGIRKDNRLYGAAEFVPSEDVKEAEVGVVLDKDATGQGMALSALKAMTDYIAPSFKRVFAEIDPKHDRSIHMCEKAGYVRKGDIVEREWGQAVVMEYIKPENSSAQ